MSAVPENALAAAGKPGTIGRLCSAAIWRIPPGIALCGYWTITFDRPPFPAQEGHEADVGQGRAARQAFQASVPCFNRSVCSLFAIFLLRDQVMRQACLGVADRVVDLLDGQPLHIPQVGARQIGTVKRCHAQISTAEIGAAE